MDRAAGVGGRTFTDEQKQWLVCIRDHIASSVEIEIEDFDYAPFVEHGGWRAYQVFGNNLMPLVNELNEVLAA